MRLTSTLWTRSRSRRSILCGDYPIVTSRRTVPAVTTMKESGSVGTFWAISHAAKPARRFWTGSSRARPARVDHDVPARTPAQDCPVTRKLTAVTEILTPIFYEKSKPQRASARVRGEGFGRALAPYR